MELKQYERLVCLFNLSLKFNIVLCCKFNFVLLWRLLLLQWKNSSQSLTLFLLMKCAFSSGANQLCMYLSFYTPVLNYDPDRQLE